MGMSVLQNTKITIPNFIYNYRSQNGVGILSKPYLPNNHQIITYIRNSYFVIIVMESSNRYFHWNKDLGKEYIIGFSAQRVSML